jgi:mono/diheme cytochrome c family protein
VIRRLLVVSGWLVGALIVSALGLAAYVHFAPLPRHPVSSIRSGPIAATPERVARGRVIFEMRCIDCHLDPTTARASGRRMVETSAQLGTSHSANITRDPGAGIGAWTDGELAYVLRTGIGHDGRLLPPWMPRLAGMSDEDLDALIAFLRSEDPALLPSGNQSPLAAPSGAVRARGTPGRGSANRSGGPRSSARAREGARQQAEWSFIGKALQHFVWRPAELPRGPVVAPPLTDRVAYGRYVVQDLAECWVCHSGEFQGLDRDHPEQTAGYLAGATSLHDSAHSLVVSANITPDLETGIGSWSERDLARALRDGVRPDDGRLRYPMPRYRGLGDAELAAVYAYLRTVPPFRQRIARALPVSPQGTTGRALYERYGCPSCHGADGVGIADLRQASARFPTDDALEAWIRHPSRIRPGARMPDFDGVIPEGDFPPLMRYVRTLGASE